MKKLFAILLTVAMLASMATVASAASTTTLTTTVPAASYTLNIPADQEIPFGEENINIGKIKVTDSDGFASGKNLKVTIANTNFVCAEVDTQIPFTMAVSRSATNYQMILSDEYVDNGGFVIFNGKADGTVSEYTTIKASGEVSDRPNVWIAVESADWGKALAGDYSATITFTAEVVAG